MGLLNFNKPKWQHKNPAVRLASIDNIDSREIEVLVGLSLEDQDLQVRRAAINRLTDPVILGQIEVDAAPEDLPFIVTRKEQLLYDQVVNGQDIDTWRKDIKEISSQEILVKLVVNGGQPEIRLAAVVRIDDQFLLAGVVEENCGKEAARAAMTKINDEELLTRLSKSAASKTARRLASSKLADLERQRNKASQDEILNKTLTSLAEEAAQLVASTDIDNAEMRLSAIKQEWQKLDNDGTHPAYGAFAKSCAAAYSRFQEVLQRRQEEQEKASRYARHQAKLDEICSTIERLTDSTANDAEAVKQQAISDWVSLVSDSEGQLVVSGTMTKRFNKACLAFDNKREKICREKDLIDVIEKESIEIRELINAANLKKAAAWLAKTEKNLASIKFKYFSRTAIKQQVAEVSAALAQAEKDACEQNLAKRREICAELKNLSVKENHNRTGRQLQILQQTWQGLPIFDGAEGLDLENRFRQAVENLNDKLQEFHHEQDWQLWANLSLKEKLVERVEAFDRVEDLETVINGIKECQSEWKTIGPIPQKKSQELWNKFHDTCDRNFQRATPYLEQLKIKRVEATARRKEICILAVELAGSTEWQKTGAAIKSLQEEWKVLMHGGRREEKELYQQFREACNRFFERRHENYKRKDKERRQHLCDKEKLCEEAEQLAAAPQADYSGKFRNLQARWKKIGSVPKEHEGAIWVRFRAACDDYFNWLGEEQQQNLKRKEELCVEVEKLLAQTVKGANQKEVAAKIAEMQQQWKEIGSVPLKQSEAIWQRFREPCDVFFKARQQQFEKEEQQRLLNQAQKEGLLAQAEELACQGTDKEIAAQLQDLQKQWFKAGSAPREIDKELSDRFKALCDAFFEGRRQYFADLKEQQLDNQRKKEILCLRLENILGTASKSVGKGRGKALSLAEELKQAMEDNFMLAGRREKKDVSEEIKRIEQDWAKIGSVPYKQNKPLTVRYKKALDGYYKSQRNK